MNVTLLSSEIVSKIRNSMQDSAINQEVVVAGLIQKAFDESLDAKRNLENDILLSMDTGHRLPWWAGAEMFVLVIIGIMAIIGIIESFLK